MAGNRYNLRTNIGESVAKGIEFVAEYQGRLAKAQNTPWRWSQYISYSYNDARYGNFYFTRILNNQLIKENLKNNRVENAPRHTLRTGTSLLYKQIKLTGQLSHTSGSFSDANNTILPTSNAQNGWIPAYSIVDITLSAPIDKQWSLSMGVNNLLDEVYFTRRASGYPGPGAMPADGRSWFITLKNQL
jgi:Fe(3+) dicitrate transport protein